MIYHSIYILKHKILSPYRKDARLPVQLQRAMAAEAEAAREARAKVCSIQCEILKFFIII